MNTSIICCLLTADDTGLYILFPLPLYAAVEIENWKPGTAM